MKLPAPIDRIVSFFASLPHTMVVSWRLARKGMYFLRDRPDWYVNGFATVDHTKLEPGSNMQLVVVEAKRERMRRTLQELRELVVKLESSNADPAVIEKVKATRDEFAATMPEHERNLRIV